jgi:hypothetical protein
MSTLYLGAYPSMGFSFCVILWLVIFLFSCVVLLSGARLVLVPHGFGAGRLAVVCSMDLLMRTMPTHHAGLA